MVFMAFMTNLRYSMVIRNIILTNVIKRENLSSFQLSVRDFIGKITL